MSQNKLSNRKCNNLCVRNEQGRSILMPKNGKITNLCRACLQKRKGMKFLSDSTEETNSLLVKWTSLNLEMEIKSKYPSYLCKICETQLNSCIEFQEQCRKSNDLINQYFIALRSENGYNKNEEKVHIAGPDTLKTSKLVFNDEIAATIQVLKEKYIQDFVCIFCRFQCTSIDDLNLHIIEAHRDLSKNWCSMCNKLYSDDNQHLEAHRKDFLCRFCNCQLFTAESTIEHLLSHKGENTELRLQPIINNSSKAFVKRENFEDLHDNTDNVCADDIKDDHALKTDISIGADLEVVELKELSKKNSANQRMRLNQYSVEDVHRAVTIVRDKLYRHVVCVFCQFEAASTRTLSVHVTRVHREFKGRWCPPCNELVDDLALHTKDRHSEDLKCSFCNKVLSNMGHFMEHMASHSGNRLHKCTVCHKSFISSRHLRTHQQTHFDERSFVCKICDKRFLQSNVLRAHIRTFHKRKMEDHCKSNNKDNVIYPQSCDAGSKDETAFFSDSSENNMNDFENRTIECQNYCNKCNKKVRSLRHHNSKFHSAFGLNQDRQNLCPHCGKRFKTMSKLTVHIRTHTGEKPYKCQYCEKRLKTRNILVVHERTHTGEKPYACAICGKNFAQSSVLKTHLRIHTGRPEQCTICDKRFCRPAELRVHMRKHTGEKPYTCNLCGQSFKQRSHLVEHTKRHSNDRPFKCNFCEKSFKNIGTLKCHLQIHTGDKPFKCSQCSYACRQPYSLTQHMQQHDNDRPQADHPHTCEICQRSFTTVAHLTAHYNRFHSHIDVKIGKPEREPSTEEVAQFKFVDDAQQIIIDDSNQIQIVESVERVESIQSISIQSELDQPKFDPMFEFTVLQ